MSRQRHSSSKAARVLNNTIVWAVMLSAVAPATAAPTNPISLNLPAWPIANVGNEIATSLINTWRGFGNKCPAVTGEFDEFPTKAEYGEGSDDDKAEAKFDQRSRCNDGDATLFAGLLCASGEELGCRTVAESQGSSGRWYRSPHRRWMYASRCFAGNFPHGQTGALFGDDCANGFSTDMGLGVLLYTLTKDASGDYKRWLEWLNNNAATTQICKWNGGKVSDCFSSVWPRYCDHDLGFTPPQFPIFGYTIGNCALHPWDTFDISATNGALGMSFPSRLANYDTQSRSLMVSLFTAASVGGIPGLPVPIPVLGLPPLLLLSSVDENYYPLHLDATRVLIRMMIANPGLQRKTLPDLPDPTALGVIGSSLMISDGTDPITINASAQIISSRARWNPYYRLLADGPSANVRQMIIDRCPQAEHKPDQTSWLWETDETRDAKSGLTNNDPSHSMGWDCVFLGNLYNRMRVPQSVYKQLVAYFEKYVDTIGQMLTASQAALAVAQQTYALDLKSVTSAQQAIDSTRNFVTSQFPKLKQQSQDALNGLTTQLANQTAQVVQLQNQLASMTARLATIPTTVMTQPARNVCNAYAAVLIGVGPCILWKTIPAVFGPNSVWQNLNGQILNVNAQITNLQLNAIKATKAQIDKINNDLADLNAQFQKLSVEMAAATFQTPLIQAKNLLNLQLVVLQSAATALAHIQEVYVPAQTRAKNRLNVWLKAT